MQKKYIIFNINTSEVSASIISFDPKKNTKKIDFSTTKKIEIEKEDALKNFQKNTKKALEKTCQELFSYFKISDFEISQIQEAFVFASTPWVKKKIENFKEEKIRPFYISKNFLDNFWKNHCIDFAENIFLNSNVISVKANQYETTMENILEKQVSKLEISLLNSYISKENKNFFDEIIKEKFYFLKVSYFAFLPTFFSQIKKFYKEQDFAFADFTGELMEFGIYQDKKIQNFLSVETGKNKIIRSFVLAGLAKSFSEGQYLFSLYLRGLLEKKDLEKVKEVVDSHTYQIEKEIKKELEKSQKIFLPKKVFIISSGEMNFLIKDMNIFSENVFIEKSFLKKLVDFEDPKYFDNFLALEIDYIFG